MCSLHELEWREEKEWRGVRSTKRHASGRVPKRRKEGSPVWGEGESQEPIGSGKKEGKRTVQVNEASVA